MSVYTVTNDQRILRYDVPVYGKEVWLQDKGTTWLIYYKTCTCTSCVDESHKAWIAQVNKSSIVSIGFYPPVVVAGRILTNGERSNLTSMAEWLEKAKAKGRVPRRLDPATLRTVVGAK